MWCRSSYYSVLTYRHPCDRTPAVSPRNPVILHHPTPHPLSLSRYRTSSFLVPTQSESLPEPSEMSSSLSISRLLLLRVFGFVRALSPTAVCDRVIFAGLSDAISSSSFGRVFRDRLPGLLLSSNSGYWQPAEASHTASNALALCTIFCACSLVSKCREVADVAPLPVAFSPASPSVVISAGGAGVLVFVVVSASRIWAPS